MTANDTNSIKQRITKTMVIGPSLANQLLQQFDDLDPQRVEFLSSLLDHADRAREDFGMESKSYLDSLAAIENMLIGKVQCAASAILAEFEDELQCKKIP